MAQALTVSTPAYAPAIQEQALTAEYLKRQVGIESVRATFNACMTIEQLDQAVADLGIDKKHPDAKAVADAYKETKTFIENAASQENF